MNKMERTMEQEINLPSQGALGSPRDRHSGAPDAAGSTVIRRKSSEGTAEVDFDSAHAEQAATVEKESVKAIYRDSTDTMEDNTALEAHNKEETPPATSEEIYIHHEKHEEELPLPVAGKRKASTSPESKDEDNEITTRKSRKPRTIASESPFPETERSEPLEALDSIIISSEEDSTEECSSARSISREKEAPLTRSAKKKRNEETFSKFKTNKFNELVAARKNKINKN